MGILKRELNPDRNLKRNLANFKHSPFLRIARSAKVLGKPPLREPASHLIPSWTLLTRLADGESNPGDAYRSGSGRGRRVGGD